MEKASQGMNENSQRQPNEKAHGDLVDINPKIMDLLLGNFKEAARGVETNTLAAFIFVALLLIPGLEGAFSEEAISKGDRSITLPILNLKAELLTAAIFGMVLYSVFCIRAASRMKQARAIAAKIATVDRRIMGAVVLYPCIATAGRRGKSFLCVSLGFLGVISWVLMYYPTQGWDEVLWSMWAMVLAPGYLYWELRRPIECQR